MFARFFVINNNLPKYFFGFIELLISSRHSYSTKWAKFYQEKKIVLGAKKMYNVLYKTCHIKKDKKFLDIGQPSYPINVSIRVISNMSNFIMVL